MARRIGEDGFPLTVWARRAQTLEPFADTDTSIAATPAELGQASDVVAVCVVADADVEEVLLGDRGVLQGMSPGGVVAIHSTIHPDTCRHLATRAHDRGIDVIDAPVSGGGHAAAEGRLLVMVGGDDEPVERCRAVFETFADPILHLGPLGSGQVAKLLNNLVFTAQLSLAFETFALAAQLGIDPNAFGAVLDTGSGGSRAAAILAATGFNTDGLRGAAPLLRKDVQLALDLTRTQNAGEPQHLAQLAAATLTTLEAPTP
jgi:3-hydroxyisobutyrate dehydrogenase-like beta-hydroxyacid dehydrogenase